MRKVNILLWGFSHKMGKKKKEVVWKLCSLCMWFKGICFRGDFDALTLANEQRQSTSTRQCSKLPLTHVSTCSLFPFLLLRSLSVLIHWLPDLVCKEDIPSHKNSSSFPIKNLHESMRNAHQSIQRHIKTTAITETPMRWKQLLALVSGKRGEVYRAPG